VPKDQARLLEELKKRAQSDPNFKTPEGFKTITETSIIQSHIIPDGLRPSLKESQIISAEIMDEILYKAVGVHFLEPIVTFEKTYRVVPRLMR